VSFGSAVPLVIDVVPGPVGLAVRAEIFDGREIEVRSGAEGTSFRSDPGHLIVQASRPDTLEILIPGGAERVEIVSMGRRVLLWDRSGFLGGPEPTTDGSYLIGIAPDGSPLP
jgi:hypothetical protein